MIDKFDIVFANHVIRLFQALNFRFQWFYLSFQSHIYGVYFELINVRNFH